MGLVRVVLNPITRVAQALFSNGNTLNLNESIKRVSFANTTNGDGNTNLTTNTNYHLADAYLDEGTWLITGAPFAGIFENHANAINAGVYVALVGLSTTQTSGFNLLQGEATMPSWGNATNSYGASIPFTKLLTVTSRTQYFINGAVSAYGTTSNTWVRFSLTSLLGSVNAYRLGPS